MLSILLLSAIMGQSCSGPSCGTPQFSGGGFDMAQPTYYLPPTYAQPSPSQYIPMLAKYRIGHGDLDLIVEGWQFTRGGQVTWEPNRPFNVQAVATAKARRSADLAASAAKSVAEPIRVRPPDKGELPVTRLHPKPEAPDAADEIGQAPKSTPKAIQNFGLRPDRIGLGKSETYTAITDEARRFVEQSGAPPSGGKIHVTVIGTEDEQAKVLNDIRTHTSFDSLRDHLLIQGYKPGEWAVDPSLGFQTIGKPAIFVQAAKGPGDKKGGRVLFRTSDYALGPAGLAQAIRKADPNYSPNRDPGPSTASCPLGFNRSHWIVIVAVGAFLVLVLRSPRKAG